MGKLLTAEIWSRIDYAPYLSPDHHVAGGGRRRRGRLPAAAAAADRRLSAGWRGGGTARACVGALRRHDTLHRRIRRGLSHVLDRTRVQPAAAAVDAPRGIRAWPRAGRHHQRGRDDRAALHGLRLAGRSGAGRRAGNELHGHRVEDAGRAHGARDPARPRHHGRAAVSGSRRGRVPDRDSIAAQVRSRSRVGARARRRQGSRRADRHPVSSASNRCAPGFTWWRGNARRSCSC